MASRPSYRGTRLHSIRIPDHLWQPALRITRARGETVSEVVTRALAEHNARYGHLDPGPDDEERERTP